MTSADSWKDYELIDTGDGARLERWGDIILERPDPQVIWPKSKPDMWHNIHARYSRSSSGGGSWDFFKKLPKQWELDYHDFKFIVEPMGFKHMGIFPEQAANWDWIGERIRGARRDVRVLNLFAYTGGATVAAAAAGAQVCHVDASKGMVQKARDNIAASGLGDRRVRYIVDDVNKFVAREKRRESYYEGIIMDPPSYGRGPGGEIWKLEDSLYELVCNSVSILSDSPVFFLLNSYTTGISPSVSANILELTLGKKFKGRVTCDEIGLPVTASGLFLPCGSYARWESKD